MNVKVKEGIVAGLSILFLVTLIISGLGQLTSPIGGIWNTSNQAYYPEYMEVIDHSLGDRVTVYRDHMGIPHIYAASEADFAFAIGYIQAQDRLFSIDIERRFVKGQISEIMGPEFLDGDKEARFLGFERYGKAMWVALQNHSDPDADTVAYLIQRFCDGLNRYIQDISPYNLPMEYSYLGITPQEYTPEDIFALGRFMAYLLSFEDWDLTTTRFADAFGKDKLFDLMPFEPFSFETPVIPNFSTPADTGEPLAKGPSEPEEDLSLKANMAKLAIESSYGKLKSWVKEFGGCSNNWVVNGSLTTTGYPILSGDPHMMLMLPSLWWEFHYVNTATGESLYGVAFPGTPFCEIGMNNFIGWSATITAIDCLDFYVETLSPDGEYYMFNNSWVKTITETEVIKVKGQSDYVMTINFTKHDYNPNDDFLCPIYPDTYYQNKAVSIKWTGFDEDPGMFLGVWKMTHARNITEFQNALRSFTGPGQNFIFGSIQGDIGIFPTAKYPIRNSSGSIKDIDGYFKGPLLLNGSNGQDEWTGYIPFEWIPQQINPDQMYLQSANQRTVNTSEYQKYYLAWRQVEGYRGRAINRYLKDAAPHSITVEDMQRLQADVFDVAASVFIPELLAAASSAYSGNIIDPWLNQTIEILTDWNESGTYADKTEVAPTIWDEFINTYQRETFSDEYAASGISGEWYPKLQALEYLTCYNATSLWFNDTGTAQKENASDIMLRSLNLTISSLRNDLGDDITEWKWGSVHQMDIRFLAFEGMESPMPELNIPKYAADGNGFTINVAPGHDVHHGPSMRMVIDFSNLAKNDTYIGCLSYPGGQSGNPLSPHWRDNFELWKHNQYHGILFPLSIDEYPEDYIKSEVVFKK